MHEKKEIDVGLALLKLWMCYEVVMVHAWDAWTSTSGGATLSAGMAFVRTMRAYAVPVFMPLAFYFAARRFAVYDWSWLKSRFIRLIVPFAFWSLLAFVTWRMLAPINPAFAMTPTNGAFWSVGCGTSPVPISFEYLGLQLLLGTTRTLGSQMWFQAVLIILTALFALFYRFIRPRFVSWGLVILFLLAAMIEHSGLNRFLFEGFRYEVCNPLGRIIPMIPYAALGLFLGSRKDRLAAVPEFGRWLLAGMGMALVAFLLNYDVFVSPPGFYYKGFKMFFVAVGLMMAFHFLPFNRLPGKVKNVIAFCARFSMGVYFMHIFLGRLLEVLVFPSVGIVPRSFAGGSVVFACCWVLCWLLSLIPAKSIKMLIE